MNNISTANLPEVTSLNAINDILINANGTTSRISISNFVGALVRRVSAQGANGIYPIDTTGLPTGDVTVPNSVTTLSSSIFQNNKNVTSVSLPSKMSALNNNSFSGCSNLQEVNIPLNATSIPSYCFHNCSTLNTVSILDNITSIKDFAFSKCTNLKNISIEEGANYSIARHAFDRCDSLTNEDVENILSHVDLSSTLGDYIFLGCQGITDITVKVVGESMFNSCPNLVNARILSFLSTNILGNSVFGSCSKLETCYLPDGITRIGATVFADCTSLKKVYLPSSINSATNNSLAISNYHIFRNCSVLEEVQLGKDWNMSLLLSMSDNFTVDSMVAMFNNLKDLTNETAKTLTLGATNLAKLSDEQKAIATNKNWTLA